MKKTILRFGSLALALLLLFQLSKYSYFAQSISFEAKIAVFGLLFLGMGVLLARQIMQPKTIIKEAPAPPVEIDHSQIAVLGISKREYEVLELIATGLSNKEIAEKLFVSESTIKTHVSNLLVKLDAKRRTQAVTKAKELRIIG